MYQGYIYWQINDAKTLSVHNCNTLSMLRKHSLRVIRNYHTSICPYLYLDNILHNYRPWFMQGCISKGQGHSVHLVEMCVRVTLLILYPDDISLNISYNVHIPGKIISSKNSMLNCIFGQKWSLGPNVLLLPCILILIHSIVVHEQRARHYLLDQNPNLPTVHTWWRCCRVWFICPIKRVPVFPMDVMVWNMLVHQLIKYNLLYF